jgi:hypothetical protein
MRTASRNDAMGRAGLSGPGLKMVPCLGCQRESSQSMSPKLCTARGETKKEITVGVTAG